MKKMLTAAALIALAAPAFAGDAGKGESEFKKCKACHMIVADDGTEIYKGGKTGPNLYGVIGRVAGSAPDFKYGDGLSEANSAGFVWTAEAVAGFMTDPKSWLKGQGYSDKSKMSFKLRKGAEDVAAYLASVGPAAQ